MKRFWSAFQVIAFAATALVLANPTICFACSCTGRTQLCQEYFQTSLIFSGTVAQVIPSTGTLFSKPYTFGYSYKFDVDHYYRGKGSTTTIVITGNGGGDCGYRFGTGGRYIVFAHLYNGNLYTGICSRTSVWEASLHKQLLNQSHSKTKTARLFGTIHQRPGKMANDHPMPGASVILDPGGRARKTVSDKDGHYEFLNVKPGDYELKFTAPAGYKADWLKPNVPQNETIVPIHLNAAGCLNRDFLAMANGTVSGRFVDHFGSRLSSQPPGAFPSEVELVSADASDLKSFYSATVKKDGSFVIDGVPEGRYLLV